MTRTSWKRHRWSWDWQSLRSTCVRCGVVRIYRCTREGHVLDSWTRTGSRIDYALPHPKACRPLPAGMRRIA